MRSFKPLVFVIFSFYASAVLAWGVEGHKTVALIAESRLTEHAHLEVQKLLALEGVTSLGDISSWADQVKGKDAESLSHAVRIPFDAENYDPKRDCNHKLKCVIYGIERSERILGQTGEASSDRLRALKFLVHYVGDIHQPLHAIKETGGMDVQLGKKKFKLHKVWDTISVRSLKMSPEKLAVTLMQSNPTIAQLTPEDWTMESHDIAKRFIYGNDQQRAESTETIILPKTYLIDIAPLVKTRLTDAGIRLANTLNQILDHP